MFFMRFSNIKNHKNMFIELLFSGEIVNFFETLSNLFSLKKCMNP